MELFIRILLTLLTARVRRSSRRCRLQRNPQPAAILKKRRLHFLACKQTRQVSTLAIRPIISRPFKSIKYWAPIRQSWRVSSLITYVWVTIFSQRQRSTRGLTSKPSKPTLAESLPSSSIECPNLPWTIWTLWRWRTTRLPWTSSTLSSRLRCATQNYVRSEEIPDSLCHPRQRYLITRFKLGQDFLLHHGYSSVAFTLSSITSPKIFPLMIVWN